MFVHIVLRMNVHCTIFREIDRTFLVVELDAHNFERAAGAFLGFLFLDSEASLAVCMYAWYP